MHWQPYHCKYARGVLRTGGGGGGGGGGGSEQWGRGCAVALTRTLADGRGMRIAAVLLFAERGPGCE